MEDTDYIHKRDITMILSQLQEDIEETKNDLNKPTSDPKDVENRITKLITEADRDLRLKTQAIVRNKLAHSRMLPIRANYHNHAETEEFLARASSPITQLKPIVVPRVIPTQNAIVTRLTNTPTASRKIAPIIPTHQSNRSLTCKTSLRRRKLPSGARNDLPHYNWHDPSEPPPPLPDDAIYNYGLDQLLQSRLLPESAPSSELNGLLTTFSIKKELPVNTNPNPTYWLDKKNSKSNVPVPLPSNSGRQPEKKESTITNDDYDDDLKGKWVFPLVNGVPDNLDSDFLAYKREYSNHWEEVEIILDMLRIICEEYCLKRQKIFGSIVFELTELDPDAISHEKLMRCFVDRSVRRRKRNAKIGFGFIGPHAEDKAATVIQSIWRGFHARRLVRQIRRNQAAGRIIQRFYRSYSALRKFRENYRNDFKRKLLNFEGNQTNPLAYKLDSSFTVLHLVESHHGSYIGRLEMLSNPNCSIILFLRKNLPVTHIEYIRSMYPDFNRVQFVVAQQRLPKTLPIEDVLASDLRSLSRIRKIAERQAIFIQPANVCDAVIEIALKLQALAIMPSTTRMMMFHTHEAVRRLLMSAKVKLFESSDEVFDKSSLCKALCGLSVTHLAIQQWRIRVKSGIIGWVNTNDFVLLERLKANTDVLTEKDLEDESFRELLEQSLSTDLNVIVETTGTVPKIDFLREVWMNGASVEAGPRQVKGSPAVAIFLPPVGSPKIVGSWETLFVSLYEPFAGIYPAFTVNRDKLKKDTLKIAAKCSEKRIIGHSIINYWYSTRILENSLNESKVKMVLTADDAKFAQYEQLTPLFLIEQTLGRKFDEESMSFGPSTYVYVQDRLEMPQPIDPNELVLKLAALSLPTESKIRFFQDFQDANVFSLVVIEENPTALITLVYRVLTMLADAIFNFSIKSEDPLLGYIHAIEYLKTQIDEGELGSTALMNKVRVRDWMKASQRRFFLAKNTKELEENPELPPIISAKTSSPDLKEMEAPTSNFIEKLVSPDPSPK
ncbi:IQ calmodulin-binding motif family protein [Tritrichomonas foetus]|uniref:IQ calmodulin-binding motif family protein n=1 Tax=Tritrichomonas foetus TaxID=1144522 RepID=A0A1J4KQ76_9EUKA|nr:IQ calmodulin-binding motif family protein [Tritrichomonas foetus]|eukprot:OHT13395.1 IQ calmodulin-binding motif family protein [Tritrichomonas foetus]